MMRAAEEPPDRSGAEADPADVIEQTRELGDEQADALDPHDAVGTGTEADSVDVIEQAIDVPEDDDLREG